MTKYYSILLLFLSLAFLSCSSEVKPAEGVDSAIAKNEITEMKIENLLRDSLELAEGVEVVVSYLELPKNTTLPLHYHPGEEFVYMIEGSGQLTLNDTSKIILKAGDVFKVPFKQIHSFSTLDEDVKGIVYRVHESGQPDRILIE